MQPTPEPSPAEDLTARGVAALRAGDAAAARALLAAAIQADPEQPRAWLWLSGVVATAAEQRFCLERAAALDPQLSAARRGLAALAAVEPARPALLSPPPEPRPPPPHLPPAPPAAAHTAPPRAAPPAPSPDAAYLNPWVWIWARPRPALRSAILARNALETATLAALAGMSGVLGWAAGRRLGADVPPASLLLLAVLAGPPLGLAALLLGGVLLRIAGRWLGGRGATSPLRAALAWAGAPLALGLPLWVMQLALLPGPSFGGARATGAAALLVALIQATHWVLWAWAALLAVLGVAEAHRVGPLRGALTWLAAAATLVGGAALVLGGAALIIQLRGG